MTSTASFCGTHATRSAENRSRLNPAGRALPGLDRTSAFAFRSTYAKRSQTKNRTLHLLFKPDILTRYEHKISSRYCGSELIIFRTVHM